MTSSDCWRRGRQRIPGMSCPGASSVADAVDKLTLRLSRQSASVLVCLRKRSACSLAGIHQSR